MTIHQEIEARAPGTPISADLVDRSIREGHRLRSVAFHMILKDVRRHLPFGA